MKPVIALFKNRGPQVYEVAPSTSVFEALQCLATHGVGALAVMAQGRLSPSIPAAEATVEQIGAWMSGLWTQEAHHVSA